MATHWYVAAVKAQAAENATRKGIDILQLSGPVYTTAHIYRLQEH